MNLTEYSQKQVIETLFGTFPRFIGPNQRRVDSMEELLSFMTAQSGATNCFVTVYAFYPFPIPLIDKIFLESDLEDNPAKGLGVGQALFEEATEKYKIPTVPLWSGNKSPHVFPLFKPEIVNDPSSLIKQVAYKLSLTSGQYHIIQEKDPITEKLVYKNVPWLDTRVLEPRRLCRFPNTRRITESGTASPYHCIILDPERFPDMDLKEILELSESPQNYPIKIGTPDQKMSEFDVHEINLDEWKGIQVPTSGSGGSGMFQGEQSLKDEHVEFMFNNLLERPCNKYAIKFGNPPHKARLSIVSELAFKGIDKNFVKFMLSLLHWFDYDPNFTNAQVDNIYKTMYKPPGWRVLEGEGVCRYESDNKHCIRCKGRKLTA